MRSLLESLRDFICLNCDLRRSETFADNIKAFLNKTYGQIQFENGLYEGDIVNTKANGIGKCKFVDGSEYEGQWLNNRMHGKGTLRFTESKNKGESYEGDFIEGVYDGKGVYKYHHG